MSSTHKKNVLFVISDGFEEVEFTAPFDILTRLQANITIAKVKDPNNPDLSLKVRGCNGLTLFTNILFEQVSKLSYDLIVLPGGMPNAEYLSYDQNLIKMLKMHKKEGKIIGAICASPALVLQPNGLLDGENATCYPSFGDKLVNKSALEQRVVFSHNVITSKGPGTAIDFGFALAEVLYGNEETMKLKGQMVFAQ